MHTTRARAGKIRAKLRAGLISGQAVSRHQGADRHLVRLDPRARRVISKTMTMAVMTPPVPAPTMAAMPTMAAEGAVRPASGRNLPTATAKDPPSVAPRYSEGEKMPPEAPLPRLMFKEVQSTDIAVTLTQSCPSNFCTTSRLNGT